MSNVLLVSGVRQSESVIHIRTSILLQILFPYRFITECRLELFDNVFSNPQVLLK